MLSMKRIFALLLAVVLLAGCQGPVVPTEPSVPPTSPTAPPTDPTAPPTDPAVPPTDPTVPPTDPTEPPLLNEPPVVEPLASDFVKARDYVPGLVVDLKYASTDNFTGRRVYSFEDGYVRYGTALRLAKVQDELAALGYGLKLWDGYRSVSGQERLWEICPDPVYVSNPYSGFRGHCRGCAVDVTLVDLETGEELVMPSGFDEFSTLGDRDYSDCAPEAAANALLLEETMERHGFTPYSGEWWHFTDTDIYPVEENFDPVMGWFWFADCREYLTLRAGPGYDYGALDYVPAGAAVRLIRWEERFARVEYRGQEGYVLASYLKSVDQPYARESLEAVELTDKYSYEMMLEDLNAFVEAWPEYARLDSLGTSELGREIPVLILGDPEAEYQVLIQGSIHAREHACTWLIMAMVDYWAGRGLEEFGNVCFHIVPMMNPDGVSMVQSGVLSPEAQAIYENDLALGYTDLSPEEYLRQWKANGLGLNRTYDAGWELFQGRPGPSSERYKGTALYDAAESRALRDYTLAHNFDVTVSYHTMGSLIYWEYGGREDVNAASHSLAKAVGAAAGYAGHGSESVDAAGYKDWAIDKLGIPSITVEIGSEDSPLALRELEVILARNLQVLPRIAQWLQAREG